MFTKCFEEGRAATDKPSAPGSDSTKGKNQNITEIYSVDCLRGYEHQDTIEIYSNITEERF